MIQACSQTPSFESQSFLIYTLQLGSERNDVTRRPNRFTFPPLIKSCVGLLSLVEEVHCHVMKFGCYEDVYVGTTLLDCYGRSRDVAFASNVFDEMVVKNVVSWNAMISGFAKCGDMKSARGVFDRMGEKNLVSWTSLVSGYAQNGYFGETLGVFEEMEVKGVKPNEITLVSVLSACANLGALGLGRRIHTFLEDNKYELDLYVGTALIDMYSKCGMVGDAIQVFERMHCRNVVSCSAMIVGLAMNGRAMEAIKIFEDMRFEGMLPGDITFIGVLCACCHAGLVEKGQFYFHSMTREYSIVPKVHHYACMVDLFGRAGHLDQAYRFIKKMPIQPDVVVWGALLVTTRTHLEFKLGVYATLRILELDTQHSGGLVFLSYAYARVGDSDGMEWVRKKMGSLGINRTPGKSWIEINNVVHQFFAGDRSHPQTDKIYAKLDELAMLLEHEGYKLNVESPFFDVEEEEKERSVNVHSEKLAVAFGLISTPEGTLIRIAKNLRVCDDCHSSMKLISKVVNRDITCLNTFLSLGTNDVILSKHYSLLRLNREYHVEHFCQVKEFEGLTYGGSLVLHASCPMETVLQTMKISVDERCRLNHIAANIISLSQEQEETVDDLFRGCRRSKELWQWLYMIFSFRYWCVQHWLAVIANFEVEWNAIVIAVVKEWHKVWIETDSHKTPRKLVSAWKRGVLWGSHWLIRYS
ncbi:hypothetical protein IFM89_013055 [Coptis chinensis]|uniref:DYW domain-containing protein n=1 Tax=Coptis chinensis TaxID=261450 RepID=A0A835LMV1_9MAGN|nr:hypothetical protein IFM89_013055 [Coptis chinensis]